MSGERTISITVGPPELIERVKAFPKEMQQAIARGMNKAGSTLLGDVTRERFTGQGPFDVSEGRLGVRTSRLRGSLRWGKAEIEGGTVTSTLGSNVRYLGVHEEGFQGVVTVRAHQRRSFSVDGERISTLTAKAQFRRKTKKSQRIKENKGQVKAHQRKMNIPARSPLGHGIADHFESFGETIAAELRALWEGKQS